MTAAIIIAIVKHCTSRLQAAFRLRKQTAYNPSLAEYFERPPIRWLITAQAQAQYRHLHSIEELIQRYSIPVVEDCASSDRKHALDLVHEHDENEKAMMDLDKNIQVCAVASRHRAHIVTSVALDIYVPQVT